MFVTDESKQQQKVETDAEERREIQSPSPAKPKHYRSLDATDLDQLQNVYPKIVSEICELISQLKHSKIEWSKFKSEEKRIMVMLCSIKQLIKVKNSIFLLHGLQPSLFSLFFGLLPFADRWVLTFLPNFHYLLLQMAKEFALTHDHFFHNCEIFQSGFSDKQKSNVGTAAPLSFSSSVSGKYFAKILDSLAELFRFFNVLQNHAQATLIDWISKISNLVVEQFKVVSELREMFALRSSLLLVPFFSLYSIKSFEMRKSLVKCLYRIHVFNVLLSDEPSCKILSHQFIAKLRECAEHLEVEQFRTLWNRIPITYLIRISEISTSKCLSFLDIAKRTQKLLGKMCMEPNEFRFVTDFLFERKHISLLQDSCSPQNWLFISGQYLFESLSCTANDETQKAATTFNENHAKQNNRIDDSASLLQKWLFIVGQFAHYCAVNRMKTPIGKTPLETFTKFEAQLRALSSSSTSHMMASRSKNLSSNERGTISYSNSNEEDQLSMNQSSGYGGKEQRNLYPEEEWFRVRMLLHCIDMVEKMMCYAVRGSMLKIYDELPLNARQFFSVNFKTCMDWLSRTALPLMSTAYANGHYAQIVRFGGFLFAELERKLPSNASNDSKIRLDPSIQFAITWVIRALVRLGAPQAIRGVQRFSETMFGPAVDFSWCHYAELLASARAEEALDGCLNFLNCAKQSKENVPKVHDHVLNAIDELALMAAGILRLPQAETKIREAIIDREEVKDDKCGESGAKMTAIFSRQSWESVLKLSSWDQLANSTPYASPTQLTTETKNESWALNNRLLETEAKIMRIFEIRQKNSIGRQNTGELLFSLQDELSDLAQFLLFGGHENSDGLAHSKLAILHAICTGIQHLNVPNQQYHVQPAQLQQHFSPKGQQSAKQMMRSPPKYSVSTPILLEVDFTDLLHNCNSNALHRLEIGQMYCGWMHRLYGAQKEHSFVLKKMHGQIAQLAQKLGNPNLANTHFRLSVQSGGTQNSWPIDDLYGNQMHRQLDIMPEYQLPMGISNLYIQQQTQPQFQSIPPGFESLLGNQLPQTEDAHNHFTVNNISFTALVTPKVTKSLLSEDFDGDSLRLLPNELAIMQQFGIDISSPQGRHFEELIGSCSTFEEFRSQIVEHFPLTDVSMNSTAILMALDQSNFTQFWLSIKHRQYRLYELALNSHLRFLENLSSEKSHVQTAEVILRFLKMLSRQPEWFQRIVTFPDVNAAISVDNNCGNKSAWMDRIPANVWTGMIPQLFACLNHSNSIVVDAIRMLLEQIGQNLPHVVCYPAIVIAGAAGEKANTMPLLSDFSKDNSERLIVIAIHP
ncbi:hypothetical protein niasHT_007353 [Heterodera trifolii]|uniref:Uncharacterized protein n=1 Tax=Heterodera trifolii TaxID=157864 RepID=A0ABD2LLQ5_9BILA